MFMCVVNLKSVNKLDLTWKQSFLIEGLQTCFSMFRFVKTKYRISTEVDGNNPVHIHGTPEMVINLHPL